MVELVPNLLRQEMARLAEQDARIDGRGRFEGREISLETDCLYNAEGSAKVTMGKTVVYAGVKFEIRTPWPDRPSEGSLMCGAELRPVAHRKYEPGPPSPESIELGRVVDRGIRESGCIDMEDLCILPGEKAWQVILDVFAVSDDGNLFDAFATAAMAELEILSTVKAVPFSKAVFMASPTAFTLTSKADKPAASPAIFEPACITENNCC